MFVPSSNTGSSVQTLLSISEETGRHPKYKTKCTSTGPRRKWLAGGSDGKAEKHKWVEASLFCLVKAAFSVSQCASARQFLYSSLDKETMVKCQTVIGEETRGGAREEATLESCSFLSSSSCFWS